MADPGGGGTDSRRPSGADGERANPAEPDDFEDFGPAEMARMSGEEWEAAFDEGTWITGERLLDRVERDLAARIDRRDVFAAVDRVTEDGTPSLAAWSDEGYAVVAPDGSVEGVGTVLRDVKASVALCSMESYDVPEPPADAGLPAPEEIAAGSGEFGNRVLQVVAAVQTLAGIVVLAAWLFGGVTTIVAPVAGGAFLFVGVFLFGVVANARLSDRFRAAEFRDRLRTVEAIGDDRPAELSPGNGSRDEETEAGTQTGATDG